MKKQGIAEDIESTSLYHRNQLSGYFSKTDKTNSFVVQLDNV